MRGSRNFRQGGPGQSHKKALTTFFFPTLIFTEVKWLISKKTIIFQGFRGGPTFSRGGGGSNFIQGGGGSTCLFPIETHITCDFPGGGGSGPPVSPSGSALISCIYKNSNIQGRSSYVIKEIFHTIRNCS